MNTVGRTIVREIRADVTVQRVDDRDRATQSQGTPSKSMAAVVKAATGGDATS